jgi:hypothetical protein
MVINVEKTHHANSLGTKGAQLLLFQDCTLSLTLSCTFPRTLWGTLFCTLPRTLSILGRVNDVSGMNRVNGVRGMRGVSGVSGVKGAMPCKMA